jgi:uncharacterized membrane protein
MKYILLEMRKERLEAFSDGVLAIIITIMILEIKLPAGDKLIDLKPIIPTISSYIISFIYIGIYWNNHHHMMHTVKHVSGGILWANLHLLFWLSLVPFVTAWMGQYNFTPVPMALYGCILLMSAIAYYILQTIIIKNHGRDSLLSRAIGSDLKGKISPILYIIAIGSTWFSEWLSGAIYILVALIWLVPDKRIEIIFKNENPDVK